MSRIGRLPITVPSGVEITIDGSVVTVKGGKGELTHTVASPIEVNLEDSTLSVTRPNDERIARSLHGPDRQESHDDEGRNAIEECLHQQQGPVFALVGPEGLKRSARRGADSTGHRVGGVDVNGRTAVEHHCQDCSDRFSGRNMR